MIFVDSNVLLDIVTADGEWLPWSLDQLSLALNKGGLVANAIVYAETSVRIPTIGELDTVYARFDIDVAAIPRIALFSAGKAFGQYRSSGGARSSILPDFLIGAHAEHLEVPLLTRDTRRYRTYFPHLELIAPDSTELG